MKSFNYTITDAQGIHARPAGLFVKVATGFKSAVSIAKDEKEADAKRIFGIMGLGIKQGEQIVVSASGEDEDQAVTALESFLKENL